MFSTMIYPLIYAIVFLFLKMPQVLGLDKRLTTNVEALKEDCFFQNLQDNDMLQIEYQVIDGGHGDLDISFYMADPTGRIMVADFKKAEKSHDIEIKTSGDYKFCFDNTFSAFNTKTVSFELYTDNDNTADETWENSNNFNFANNVLNPDIQQFEDFKEAVDAMRHSLSKARTLQDTIKMTQAKDRNIAEENFLKVNLYSIFVLAVMIFVSFIQILMVKSIFDNKSKLSKVLCFFDVNKYL